MSKKKRAKKRAVPKTGAVWRQTSEEAALAKMPKYNAFAGGYGPHGNKGYDRAKAKQDWRRQMGQEGASRGSFPFARKRASGLGQTDRSFVPVHPSPRSSKKQLDPLVASGPMMPSEDMREAMGWEGLGS